VTATFKSYDTWQWAALDTTDFYYAGKDPLSLLTLSALPKTGDRAGHTLRPLNFAVRC